MSYQVQIILNRTISEEQANRFAKEFSLKNPAIAAEVISREMLEFQIENEQLKITDFHFQAKHNPEE